MKFLPLLMLLTLIGCGGSEDSGDETFQENPYFQIEENDKLHDFTKGLVVTANTPSGVGTLLSLHDGMWSSRNVGLCTWFLVAPDKAMTNSHCIPEALKTNPDLGCGEYLQGGIQTNSGTLKKTRCEKLIYFSTIPKSVNLNNDYALIQFENKITDAKIFKLDRKGIMENEKVTILTMNHHSGSGTLWSDFKEHRCVLKSSDMLGRINSPGSSPVTGFQEEGSTDYCKIIGGNSGSPVLDKDGRLVGILHGGMKENPDLNLNVFEENKLTTNIGIITNLRCQKFQDSKLDSGYPVECKDEKMASSIDLKATLTELQPQMEKHIADALLLQPKFFEYENHFVNQGVTTTVDYVVKCVKPLAKWSEEDLAKVETTGFISKEKSLKSSTSRHKLTLGLSLDYYGNLKIEISFKQTATLPFQMLDLHHLEKNKQVKVAFGSATQRVPVCSN